MATTYAPLFHFSKLVDRKLEE